MAGAPQIFAVAYRRKNTRVGTHRLYISEWAARQFVARLESYGIPARLLVADTKWRVIE